MPWFVRDGKKLWIGVHSEHGVVVFDPKFSSSPTKDPACTQLFVVNQFEMVEFNRDEVRAHLKLRKPNKDEITDAAESYLLFRGVEDQDPELWPDYIVERVEMLHAAGLRIADWKVGLPLPSRYPACSVCGERNPHPRPMECCDCESPICECGACECQEVIEHLLRTNRVPV